MQEEVQHNAQDPANRTEKKEIEKKGNFNWWQATLILVATLAICLGGGYFISSKYLWNTEGDQLNKQLDYYQGIVDQKPNDPKSRIQLGYIYFLKHDYDNAIKQYQVAKNLDKNDFDAYLNLSIVYDKLGRNDDSLQMAIKASKISPQDYKGQLLKGRAYRKLKMYKQASSALQEAYRFKPGNVDILYEVGLVAVAEGKKSEAEQIFKQALSYDPTYKPAQKSLEQLTSK